LEARKTGLAQAGILEAIGISYPKSISIEHDLFLSLQRKLKEWRVDDKKQNPEFTFDLWSSIV
jgi:hypothetical protein